MALLSDTFTDLCAKHDLTAASVGIQKYEGGFGYVSYVHWSDGESRCSSSHGDTPEDALRGAISEANAKRSMAPSIEALEVAA